VMGREPQFPVEQKARWDGPEPAIYRIKDAGALEAGAPRRFTYSSASYAGDVGLLSGGTFPSMREWHFNPSL
jgi:hypothetical protein